MLYQWKQLILLMKVTPLHRHTAILGPSRKFYDSPESGTSGLQHHKSTATPATEFSGLSRRIEQLFFPRLSRLMDPVYRCNYGTEALKEPAEAPVAVAAALPCLSDTIKQSDGSTAAQLSI